MFAYLHQKAAGGKGVVLHQPTAARRADAGGLTANVSTLLCWHDKRSSTVKARSCTLRELPRLATCNPEPRLHVVFTWKRVFVPAREGHLVSKTLKTGGKYVYTYEPPRALTGIPLDQKLCYANTHALTHTYTHEGTCTLTSFILFSWELAGWLVFKLPTGCWNNSTSGSWIFWPRTTFTLFSPQHDKNEHSPRQKQAMKQDCGWMGW